MTLLKGKFLKPDGTPIQGVEIKANLTAIGGESAGLEIYSNTDIISTISDVSGAWQLELWANSNGVTNTKYKFQIKYPTASTFTSYELEVPGDVEEVLFTDLLAATTQAARDLEIYNIEATKFDFSFTQGNTVNRHWDFADASNQPIDLTGWTGIMGIKLPNNAIQYLTCTIDGPKGRIAIHMADTDSWVLGDSTGLKYELAITNSTETIKMLYGDITVKTSFIRRSNPVTEMVE